MTKRFENSVMKLYKAFHEGTLNAMDCRACACGNICDNTSDWCKKDKTYYGYSPEELSQIENIFMFGQKGFGYLNAYPGYEWWGGKGWNAEEVKSKIDNHLVFHALCAVVQYLCELDKIANPMDYTKLFEQEEGKPKHANLCATE